MPKDRFNTRASWDTSFKYSGQLMPKSKSSSKYRTKQQQDFVDAISSIWNSKMNDWESNFVTNIRFSPWTISNKQWKKLTDINEKYNLLFPDFAEGYCK